MSSLDKQPLTLAPAGEAEAIRHLRQAITGGEHWYIALLEAIGLWVSTEETYNGRHYRYLIADQAFDWLLLAERLCQEASDLLPEQEMLDLLFSGQPPIELSEQELEALIGSAKYRAHLNYYYGITVEQALLLAVEEEIEKEHRANVSHNGVRDGYCRVYGADEQTLIRQFREEKSYSHRSSITLPELHEFTYWLFQYRLRNSERARVASDTKKALAYLKRGGEGDGLPFFCRLDRGQSDHKHRFGGDR